MPPKRQKGVTFKLVHRPHDDEDDDQIHNAVMVEERELQRHLPPSLGGKRCRQRQEDNEGDTNTISDWANEWTSTATGASSFQQRRLPDDTDDSYPRNGLLAGAESNGGAGDANSEEEEEEDDNLFEDQDEVDFTDDFIQEIVFGDAGAAAADDDDDGENSGDALEKDNNIAAQYDESVYAQHDVTKRGVDRQFAQMLREFNVDARLNEAYTDDPRAHGALEVDQYIRALEEFVVDRAGIDYGTSEPLRNKGLIQQFKNMALSTGVAMTPSGEVYTTTLLPDKHARFAAEFYRESEDIRQAAQRRIHEKQKQVNVNGAETTTDQFTDMEQHLTTTAVEEEEEEEAYVIRDVRDRTNRMDCETAVSAYSTYFNQPNVIRPPLRARRRKGGHATADSSAPPSKHMSTDSKDCPSTEEDPKDGGDRAELTPQQLMHAMALARHQNETKEEKKMRQQLVKQAQRERRGKKNELKNMYKTLEADESKRSKESQMAKKTVHFY